MKRHPLILPVLLLALLILLGEQFFGCFSRWCNPARNADHYSHCVGRFDRPDQCAARFPRPNQCAARFPRADIKQSNNIPMLAKVKSLPSKRAKTFRTEVEVIQIVDTNGDVFPCKGKMLIYLPYRDSLSFSVGFGDTLLLLVSPQLPDTAIGADRFNYRKYLLRKGILYTAYVPPFQFRIVGHDRHSFSSRIAALRQRILNTIRFSQLSPSQQAIAEALIVGYSDDLDEATRAQFRTAGISHLLCVSGLHVGIVAMLAGWLLSFIGNRRPNRIFQGIMQLALVWLFVLLTQMAPATLRAAIMFSFIIVGQMFFIKPSTLNSVAASALVLLTCKPLLLFDVGFQLSYVAVIAIVLFVRPLEDLISHLSQVMKFDFVHFCGVFAAVQGQPKSDAHKSCRWLLRKLRSLFCVSLVAQLALLPLVLYYFHNFPTYFLVANMTVVPLAAFLLGGVLIMVLLCWWPWAFSVVGWAVSMMLKGVEWLTATIASWPYALIEGIRFDVWMMLVSFGIIASLGTALILWHKGDR